jgi:hypothetical protein
VGAGALLLVVASIASPASVTSRFVDKQICAVEVHVNCSAAHGGLLDEEQGIRQVVVEMHSTGILNHFRP